MRAAVVSLTLCCLVSEPRAQGWFDAPRLLEIAEGGECHALGDFEGDGDEDLLWFEGEPGAWTGMRVLFNDGTGEFSAGPLTVLTGQRWPYDEALRDFTGDGLADALVQQREIAAGAGVEVWPGLADGSFGAAYLIPFLVAPEDLAVGNIDGDAAFELATRQSDNGFSDAPQKVRWWNFQGSGFTGSAELVLPGTATGAGVADIVALDLGGNGIDDLAAGELVGDGLHLLLTVGGAPVLGASVTLPLPTATMRIHPLVGDLEGDGDDDLVCSIKGSTLYLVAVEQSGGAMIPGPAQSYASWSWIDGGRPTAVADWDEDGDLDVLSHNGNISAGANEGTLVFLENDGAHQFVEAGRVMTGVSGEDAEVGPGPADLDADGHLDYAGIRSLVFGVGRFEPVLQEALGFATSIGPGLAVDTDGDGDLDVVRAAPASFGGQFLGNDATASFDALALLPAAPASLQYGAAAAIADFDGDGRADLLLPLETAGGPFDPPVFQEMRLAAALAVGGFADTGAAAPPGERILAGAGGLLPVADLDGDGDLDLLDRHGPGNPGGFWANDGSGFFAHFAPLFAGEPLLVLDVDGDGNLEVLTHETGPERLDLQHQTGPLAFTAETVHTGFFGADTAALADLDGDGDQDLLLGEVIGGPVELAVYENTGGAFTWRVSLPADPSADDVLGADDVDGDGLVDILAARGHAGGSEPDRLVVYRAAGSFTYELPRAWVAPRIVGFDDLDGDGDLDAWGQDVVRSRRFDGPEDGIARQYGAGAAGSGGAVPVLGAVGPLRPGSLTASLELGRGLANAPAWLAVGNHAIELAGVPFPGFTLFIDPLVLLLPVPLPGPPGPGQGALSIPLFGVLDVLAGLTRTYQLVVLDPGSASGLAHSNGLEITYGN